MLSRILPTHEDRRLVKSFLNRRDEAAFRELYRRHTPGLYQVALRLMGWNVHDAEEVVQETWVRAINKLSEFQWRSSLRTWLTSIAINRCRELFRRATQTTDVLPADAEHIRDIIHIDLERIIADLPPGYRMVLILHDIEGYTHEEIGRMLEIETGTSKSQLSRARHAVREAMKENETTHQRREVQE